jgi:uncharacterized OsmC-like protein
MTAANLVNGLDIKKFEKAVALIAKRKVTRHAPKKARIRWKSGFKFSALVRNHMFMIDEPAQLTGEDEQPNSMEYVLGALGACLATGFVLLASKANITIHNMEVTLESRQENVLTFLGVEKEKGHSGFDQISAKLYIQADGPRELLTKLWHDALHTSPVGNSLVQNVDISPEIDIIS